jgi:hypothetical protein
LPSGLLIVDSNNAAVEAVLFSVGVEKIRKTEKPKKIIAKI